MVILYVYVIELLVVIDRHSRFFLKAQWVSQTFLTPATTLTIVPHPTVRVTLPSALNVMNASSVGKLVQLVTASRLILYHKGQIDPMKDECHYQIKH